MSEESETIMIKKVEKEIQGNRQLIMEITERLALAQKIWGVFVVLWIVFVVIYSVTRLI